MASELEVCPVNRDVKVSDLVLDMESQVAADSLFVPRKLEFNGIGRSLIIPTLENDLAMKYDSVEY